ncbi:Glucanosyltransferase-domain-containing protein [Leptodontidium sp. 2 PMI_412]|nr:1,3-beta-glucanosyltransferase gel4 [Leptodontidium sp. MPI-SDFR-AT-0119]KAH9209416.1 Glucanosyltransferase-domain-containing protein [Leptodontidium sp. 2 PMI_412]
MVRTTPLVSLLTAATLLVSSASAALDPIVIKGSKFFYKTNGTQFFIKGVAYQQGVGQNGGGSTNGNTAYTDPLADVTSCTRDIPLLQKAGANTIRTYAIDPTQDHTQCMTLLDAAGIYVISDLGEPNTSINRQDPEWNVELFNRYTAVVDSLAKFTNTIGFFAGNEVPNNLSYTGSSAFVKAAVRDTKAYIKSKNYHSMGVGYAADDLPSVRANVAAYFNCGPTEDQIDFWGYNIYEWCGDSDYVTSGYKDRVAEFSQYSVPSFFAEYGCNTQGGGAAGRKFTEIEAIYGSNMTEVFSGGIVYEFFQEENDYGLASVDGSSISTLADYAPFSSELNAAKPTGVNSASYNPTNTVGQSCPAVASTWAVAETGLPPTPNQSVCDCMMASLTCTVNTKNVNDTQIGDLFGQVCGYNGGEACVGISTNTTTGKYGAYSMCSPSEKLSNAFDTYYQQQKKAATACDFAGAAQIVKAAGAASSCSSIIAAATSGGATVPTGSGSSAATSTTKKSEASGMVFSSSLGMGKFFAVGFTIVAVLSGAGMILL